MLKSNKRGVHALRNRHEALYGSARYYQKVLRTGPIAYWPLWEASGTTAQCLVNSAQNGTYNSDVSGWPPGVGIGDGHTAPYFDGTNDYINIMSASLSAGWNFVEGSMAGWARVNSAAVWTDGTARALMRANGTVPSVQGARFLKSSVNNQMDARRWGNGVFTDANYTPFSSTVWFPWAVTWSEAANQLLIYANGTQVAAGAGLNAAVAGALFIAFIGSESAVPAGPWHGWLAHCAAWDRPLSQPEIANLAAL